MTQILPLTLAEITVRRAGRMILGPLDLSVEAGGALVVLGPNGSGKSTLLRVCHGITRASSGAARDRAISMLHEVGLQDAAHLRASVLSGGEKQKLALARALVTRPEVLFLDEPTASLDGRSTREIETILAAAQAQGTKLVMATHDLGQARRIAAHVVFLLNGKIVETSAAEPFFNAPQTLAARAFLKGDIVE